MKVDDDASVHREAFNCATDGLFIIGMDDTGMPRLIDGNPAWEAMIGINVALLRGCHLAELPAGWSDCLLQQHRACLRRASRTDEQWHVPTPQGPRSVRLTLTPAIDKTGRIRRLHGAARDVTPRLDHTSESGCLLDEQADPDLWSRLEAARDEERRHIARELHDEMGQRLSALRMEVSILRMRWGGLDRALGKKTTAVQAMVDGVIQVTRNLVRSLRPPVLDLGIVAALEWLMEDFRASSCRDCHLHIDEACNALDPRQTAMVFRVVQESLTNIGRHAQAHRVDVTLKRSNGQFVLMVRDDGQGFDPRSRPRRSLGLVGIQERAQMLGGQLDLRSTPGLGTTLCIAFPASTVAVAPGIAKPAQ